jgi:hypothetical protein
LRLPPIRRLPNEIGYQENWRGAEPAFPFLLSSTAEPGLGRRRSANISARPKGASIWSRSSGSNRTPNANVAEANRSKASAVDESGPYASPNFASNQRCTRAWLRTSTLLAAVRRKRPSLGELPHPRPHRRGWTRRNKRGRNP